MSPQEYQNPPPQPKAFAPKQGPYMNKNLHQNQQQTNLHSPNFKSTHTTAPKVKNNFVYWVKHHKWLFGAATFLSVFLIITLILGLITGFNFSGFSQKLSQNVQNFIASTSIQGRSEDFNISPEKKDSLGVFPDSSFTLKSKGDVTINQIQKNISISPQAKIRVEQASINEFKITPENNLNQNQIYKLSLKIEDKDNQNMPKDLSWGFQIQNPFRIVSTTPRNKATSVPLNTGIEIAFSADSFNKIEDSFEITPKVKGSFQKTKSILSFVPEKLAPRTLYTVKIKKGLALENSKEVLQDDYTFQFETQDKDSRDFSVGFTRSMYEFKTDEKPALSVFVAPSTVVKANVNLYKFNDLAQFLNYLQQNNSSPSWSVFSRFGENFDLTQLTKTVGQEMPIQNSNANQYIELPQILSKGYYLAQVDSGDFTDSAPIQIIDNAAYLSQSDTKTVVWAVDLINKKGLSSASIKSLDGKSIISTNDEGTAFFDTPQDFKNDKTNYYQVISGSDTLILPAANSEYGDVFDLQLRGNRSTSDYWNYLYFDRPLYRKTDTLNYWGVLKNRSGGQEGIQAVLYQQNDTLLKVDSKNIAVSSQGTFLDSFKLENIPAGSYLINIVNSQNQVISSKNFIVQDFVKPVYQINLTTDKQAYFGGQDVLFSGEISFYDGIGVSNIALTYDFNGKGEVITDSSGKFEFTRKINKDTSVAQTNNFYTNGGIISIWPKESQESDNTFTKYFPVINSQIGASIEQKIEDSKATIDLTLSSLTLDKINQNTSTSSYDFGAAPLPNKEVQAYVTAYTYDKVKIGQYYNFITKKTEDTYDYRQRVLKTDILNLKTNDQGIARSQFSTIISKEFLEPIKSNNPDITLGTNLDFTVNFNFLDLDAQPLTNTESVYQAERNFFAGNNYTIDDASGANNYYKTYKVDEPINLSLNNPKKTAQSGGQYLFYFAGRGINEFNLQDRNEIKFNFKDTFVPNVYVFGVHFDGRNFFLALPRILSFDSKQKLLDIKVKTDKIIYKPKDSVDVDFEVTGIDNKPRNTQLNISVVDESLFSLAGDYNDILPELYQTVSSGVSAVYNSHQNPGIGLQTGGRGGAGGAGQKRSNFLDTVAFQTLQTDDQGKAKFSFKLPDNITKWRITTQAVTVNLEAGKQLTSITTSQDFLVSPSISSTFLTGDKPVLKLRSFGKGLGQNSNINYKIESESLNLEPFSINGAASTSVYINLPELTTGEHKLKITATSAELNDVVEKSFTVIDSKETFKETKNYKLTDDINLEVNENSNNYQAVFSTGEKSKYLNSIELLASQTGDRLDQKISKNEAKRILQKEFGQNLTLEKIPYQMYQGQKNGLTLLPYSGDDLAVTVMALMTNRDELPKETIKDYLYKIVNSKTEGLDRTSLALFGLSLLEEKVLNQVQNLLNKGDASPIDKIYLSLAAVQNGDLENGRKIYKYFIKNNLKDNQNFKYINISDNQDDNILATSLLSVLGVNLDEKYASDFYDFNASTSSNRILTILQQITYLQKAIPLLSSLDGQFTYILNGKEQTEKLSKGQSFSLLLNSDQAKNIRFKNVQGQINLNLVSNQPPRLAKTLNPNYQVSRKYFIDGIETTSFKSTDVVTVELSYKLPETKNTGCVQIIDYLPSGLRSISPQSFGESYSIETKLWYPYFVDNQIVSFCVNTNNKSPVRYFARVINKGEFKAEATSIQNTEATGETNFGKPVIVVIN